MAAERQERLYRLEPLDASGIFLGLGVIQSCLLGAGITLAVALVTAGLPVPVAAVPIAAGAALSFARIRGHPAWEWLPLGVGWLWASVRRGRRWTAPLPLLPTDETRPPPLPPCLVGLDVVQVPWGARHHLGAIRDRQRQTLTALVRVSGPQFALETRAEQERLLMGWGDVLAQFAVDRGPVTQVFWSDLVRRSLLDDHLAWLAADGAANPATESYDHLLDTAASSATAHEVVVGLTVAHERLNRRRRGGGDEQLERSAITAVEALVRGLHSAGTGQVEPLDSMGLHKLLRSRIDPLVATPARRRCGRLANRLGIVTPASSGPLVVETAWRHVRVDGAWHRTWWVSCWPRLAVPPSWLEPFLSSSGLTRVMTVGFLPVPTHQSRRRIERDLVKLDSDAATKEDKGRRVDARHHRSTQALLDREAELVSGYAEMAYVGLVSVVADSEEDLEHQSEIVEQLAREAGMELRLLDGRQDLAWAATMPLGLIPRSVVAG